MGSSPLEPGGSPLPRAGEWIDERYQILRPLGRGGMGAVFVAQDRAGREVALKVLLGHRAESEARFRVEAEALAKLNHPGIVVVHDFGVTPGGMAYLVMGLVEGESLDDHLKQRGTLEPMRAVDLAAQLAHALAHAHKAGVLHRDLKPENVLITPDGRAVLTDFGVAKVVDQSQHLSKTGQLLGTPAYMSPEQAMGKVREVGPGTDVYGLGSTLYDMLCGRPPFCALRPLELLVAISNLQPDPPSQHQAGLDAKLDAICLTCLAKAPSARYSDMPALIADLEAYQRRDPIAASLSPARPWQAGLLVLALVLALAVGSVLWISAGDGQGAQAGGAVVSATPRASVEPELSVTPARVPVLRWGAPGSAPPVPSMWGDQVLTLAGEVDRPVTVLLGALVPRGSLVEEVAVPREVVMRDGRKLKLLPAWEGVLRPGSQTTVEIPTGVLLGIGFERYLAVALDPDGVVQGEPLHLRVARPPDWLETLPKSVRPPRLPLGVVATNTPGRYRNRVDGSHLSWVPPGQTTLFEAEQGVSARLEEGVFLGTREVTQSQYTKFLRSRRRPLKKKWTKNASVLVDWFQAQEYCRWAGARLPTEIEWSRAAWGTESNWEQVIAGYRPHAAPFRGKEARSRSIFGCMDMLDNLAEYVLDPAHPPGTRIPARIESAEGGVGKVLVLGGAWNSSPKRRSEKPRTLFSNTRGFRICIDASGRTRGPQGLKWQVELGQFTPGPPVSAGSVRRRPPRSREIKILSRWPTPLSSLAPTWPFLSTLRAAGTNALMEGVYLRATTTVHLRAGDWALAVVSDDGVRVSLRVGKGPSEVLIDRWTHHMPTFDRVRFTLKEHSDVHLELEYCNIEGPCDLQLGLTPE